MVTVAGSADGRVRDSKSVVESKRDENPKNRVLALFDEEERKSPGLDRDSTNRLELRDYVIAKVGDKR